MVITVPTISFIEIFCLWINAYGTMMSTGVGQLFSYEISSLISLMSSDW